MQSVDNWNRSLALFIPPYKTVESCHYSEGHKNTKNQYMWKSETRINDFSFFDRKLIKISAKTTKIVNKTTKEPHVHI